MIRAVIAPVKENSATNMDSDTQSSEVPVLFSATLDTLYNIATQRFRGPWCT